MKTIRAFRKGDRVTVTVRYRGKGRYEPDGCEGTWTVISTYAPCNLRLVRVDASGRATFTTVHLTRIEEAQS